MVVLSDGQPNRGLVTTADLATFTASLRPIGVSSLGFGAHHDEQVLAAIATAGSGQLEDEAANYERRGNAVELAHQRKAAMVSTAGTATAGAQRKRHARPAPGALIGLSHDVQNRRFQLYQDTSFGRSPDNEVQIHHGSISLIWQALTRS
jgi:hypothetical protein